MQTIDFSRSFLTFRIDRTKKPAQTQSHKPRFTLNNVRIQIECRCRITDSQTSRLQTFVLGASCKTERVGVDRDIWTEPNADFAPVFSDDGFMNLKTFARAGVQVDLYPPSIGKQSDRQTGRIDDAFDRVRIELAECEGELLAGAEEIVQATLAGNPLVARTEIQSGRYTAVLEYPVKTMNANERDNVYQTDTGPVLLPDLSREPDELLQHFQLAYSAFNSPDWIELIERAATSVAPDVDVYHYSRPLRLNVKNQVIRLS